MPTSVRTRFHVNKRPAMRKLKQLWRLAHERGRVPEIRARLDALDEAAWFDFSQRLTLHDGRGPYTYVHVRLAAELRELVSELRYAPLASRL